MGHGDIPMEWRVTVLEPSDVFWDESMTEAEGIELVSLFENLYGGTLSRTESPLTLPLRQRK